MLSPDLHTLIDSGTDNDSREMVRAIVDELEADRAQKADLPTAQAVVIGPTYDDIADDKEAELQKVARLKRLVQSGQYEIDLMAVADALLKSGDLQAK